MPPDRSITHARAAILSIGDELAIGQSVDTNTAWIADRLTGLGVRVEEHRTVADDLHRLSGAIVALSGRHDLLIATGGLGPTEDDLTRDALAASFGMELVEDDRALGWLRAWLGRSGRTLDAGRQVQALRPAGAACLFNDTGTAPGLHLRHDTGDVFCLPGPPREMQPMFEREVLPLLELPADRTVATSLVRLCGVAEAEAARALGGMMRRGASPVVGTTASGGLVTVRVRFEGAASEAEHAMGGARAEIQRALGDHAFGEDDQTLPGAVVDLLRERGERLVVAESCTGGLLGGMITAVPGASDAFDGGWITYSNAMKRAEVGVPADIVDGPPGAVSGETVASMAAGALEASRQGAIGAHHALAISGIAGPGGGTDEKPVGTVWIGRAWDGGVEARRFLIPGARDDIRERSVVTALVMLWRALRSADATRPLLWETTPA